MMKCPSCEHENVDGTTFCEMCGEELESSASTSAVDSDAADSVAVNAPLQDTGEITCPACENKNPADNIACEICGTELGNSTSSDDEVPHSTPAVTADADIDDAHVDIDAEVDTAIDAAAPAPLDSTPDAAPDVSADAAIPNATPSTSAAAPLVPGSVKLVVEQGMIVGKQFVLGDSESQVGREDEDEEIYPDIDLADQDEGYVHREHATLTFENDALFVTHLGGANRTRLNNKPIPDNEPQAIKLGDKLAFGKVVLRVLPA